MDYALGALGAAAFFVLLCIVYTLGQMNQHKKMSPTSAPKEADEEERRKAERMKEGFNQLMSYDVTTATSGKKVVH